MPPPPPPYLRAHKAPLAEGSFGPLVHPRPAGMGGHDRRLKGLINDAQAEGVDLVAGEEGGLHTREVLSEQTQIWIKYLDDELRSLEGNS